MVPNDASDQRLSTRCRHDGIPGLKSVYFSFLQSLITQPFLKFFAIPKDTSNRIRINSAVKYDPSKIYIVYSWLFSKIYYLDLKLMSSNLFFCIIDYQSWYFVTTSDFNHQNQYLFHSLFPTFLFPQQVRFPFFVLNIKQR